MGTEVHWLALFLIDAGYWLVTYTVMGVVLELLG